MKPRLFNYFILIVFLPTILFIGVLPKTALAQESSTQDSVTQYSFLQEPTILVLGDSFSSSFGFEKSAGWVALLEKRLKEKAYPVKVINESQAALTAKIGLHRLPALLSSYHPTIVLLGLGGNDALFARPPNMIKDHLIQMIELSNQHHAKVLLIAFSIPKRRSPEYRKQFENIFTEIFDQYQLPKIPFILEKIKIYPEYMQADGLHPNETAQPIILESVWPEIEQLLIEHQLKGSP